ncbi:MAG TPA: PIN domain-containing protein [Acidisarcina sp.]
MRRLVVDANILLRGVFGVRVLGLIESYEHSCLFYSPDACFEDARKYIAELATKRGIDPSAGLRTLDQLSRLVEVVDLDVYASREDMARQRISSRDVDDWPIVAAALLLTCPIWTEDQDFFGSGIAVWTTQNIEVYLKGG